MTAVAAVPVTIVALRFTPHESGIQLPPLSDEERALAAELAHDVRVLASEIGPRNVWRYPRALAAAAAHIEGELTRAGLAPKRQPVASTFGTSDNIVAELRGTASPERIVVIGAHYDSWAVSPGANDNASGVAALLALARRLRAPQVRTIRFVAFTNEEPPLYRTEAMGSVVYAESVRGQPIEAMLSLETLGYYRVERGTQEYPWPLGAFYPDAGDFVGFVGNLASRALVGGTLQTFRAASRFPAGAVSLPDAVDGLGWSDHWAFWRIGVQAVMVTDTAPFRYPYYHSTEDTADKLDYEALARVVAGLVEGPLGAPAGAGAPERRAVSRR